MKENANIKDVLAVLKTSPPVIGTTVASELVLKLAPLYNINIRHVDASDHRSASTLGKWDWKNMLIAFRLYTNVLHELMKKRPDAIYIYGAQSTIAFYRDIPYIVLAKLFKTPVVSHLHGGNFAGWYNNLNEIHKLLVKVIYKFIDRQIVLANCLAEQFEGLIDTEKVYVVRNGLEDLGVVYSESNNANKQIIYLSNFIKTKGYLDLFSECEAIAEMYPNVNFLFAGGWRSEVDREMFEDMVKGSRASIKIINGLYGHEKHEEISRSYLFVLPTYYPNEGQPYALVEALRSGLPIVSTNHAAIPEMVQHKRNGYLFEKRDTVSMRLWILDLLRDEELAKSMARESRVIYEREYSERSMMLSLRNVFDSVQNS
jgi:glycosyltransferase involved in cell wall biosynthesis